MKFTLSPVQAPTTEPVTLADVKSWVVIDGTDDDSIINGLIRVARERIEATCGRAFVSQQWDLLLDAFPRATAYRPDGDILIPRAPLHQVTSIQYVDDDGATQTLATSDYTVDRRREPARIIPAYGESWPSTRDVPNAVTVRFRSGYAIPFTVDAGTDVLTAVGHPFANGDAVRVFTVAIIPTGLAALTTYYVRDVSGDTFKLAATSGGAAIDITVAGTAPNLIGFAGESNIIPEPLIQALKLVVTRYYRQHDAVLSETPRPLLLEETDFAARALVAPYRLFPGLVSES